MRYLVFSDLHGQTKHMIKVIEQHPEADAIIFLGDGASAFRNCAEKYSKPLYIVRGNCDIGSNEKVLDFISYNDHKIMICHGHHYHVKHSLDDLIASAKLNFCDIILFGHTHIPLSKYTDGLYIMNPGTIAVSPNPTYGILDIDEQGILAHTASVY